MPDMPLHPREAIQMLMGPSNLTCILLDSGRKPDTQRTHTCRALSQLNAWCPVSDPRGKKGRRSHLERI
ncbi:hypothetical protein ILYODFUR_009711 [Ilyodon furcidens]|uniref:Uncharacterized protein n=1 Tax=Ilyodon furcidens TaxID=33524 RepID=A0ABV0U5B9_9TELE